jgi:hypothetical protein
MIMLLSSALEQTGVAQAEWNGYVFTVKDGQGPFDGDYVLTIQKGMMPPHVTKTYDNIRTLESDLYEGEFSHMPGLDFEAVEMEV